MGQCLVLEPVSLNLSVTRNLAFGWYKEIPAVDISGHLESIEVSLRSMKIVRSKVKVTKRS